MSEDYFSRFPTVVYGGKVAIDITRRVKIPEKVRNAIDSYHVYDNAPNLRPDLIAEHYYGSPRFRWLVYLSGKIVDPYYQVYLNDTDFFSAMEEKYGSYEDAVGKVAFWRLNWPSDEAEMSDSLFNQLVPPEMRKYYRAVYLGKEVIGSWIRVREDWSIGTNRIDRITLPVEPDPGFTVGERLVFSTIDENVASAEVEYHSGTKLLIKNPINLIEAGQTITGATSGAESEVGDTETVAQPIPPNELDFWSPVSFWDMEKEFNDDRRFVTLIDAVYSREVSDDLGEYLSGKKV